MRRLIVVSGKLNGRITGVMPGRNGLPEVEERVYVFNWLDGNLAQYMVTQVWEESNAYDAVFDRFVTKVDLEGIGG